MMTWDSGHIRLQILFFCKANWKGLQGGVQSSGILSFSSAAWGSMFGTHTHTLLGHFQAMAPCLTPRNPQHHSGRQRAQNLMGLGRKNQASWTIPLFALFMSTFKDDFQPTFASSCPSSFSSVMLLNLQPFWTNRRVHAPLKTYVNALRHDSYNLCNSIL